MVGGEQTSAPHRAELRSGDSLGKYRIVRRIGAGGMATIYLATSAGPGGFEKPCALKLMRPEFSEGQGAEALIKEARIAAHLNHPNIIQVYDLGRVGADYYMTMEWVEGVALNDLLAYLSRRKQKPSVGASAFIAMQVAEALAYLGSGVMLEGGRVSLVHRDVSPSNVLISTSGVVKLADFGIVKVLEAPTSTRVGVVKGKYAYMSPEQLRGDALDHRSDLFALGIVLWEVLTCARLFYRKSLPATIGAVSAAKAPPPSELNNEVPSELDHLTLRLLSKAPDNRFSNAEEVVGLLQRFVVSASRVEVAALARECADAPETMRRTSMIPMSPTEKPPTIQETPPPRPLVHDLISVRAEVPKISVKAPPPAPEIDSISVEIDALESLGEYSGDDLPDYHTVAEIELSQLRAADTIGADTQASLFRSAPSEIRPAETSGLWIAVVIVGAAVAASAAFWWALLG
jgi:serine/threonine protein kinase